MPGRGRPTFNKRQKEQKRTEKRREKEAKREERKLTSQPLSTEEMIAAEALAMAEAAALAAEEAADGSSRGRRDCPSYSSSHPPCGIGGTPTPEGHGRRGPPGPNCLSRQINLQTCQSPPCCHGVGASTPPPRFPGVPPALFRSLQIDFCRRPARHFTRSGRSVPVPMYDPVGCRLPYLYRVRWLLALATRGYSISVEAVAIEDCGAKLVSTIWIIAYAGISSACLVKARQPRSVSRSTWIKSPPRI